jgi:hypothetical protein
MSPDFMSRSSDGGKSLKHNEYAHWKFFIMSNALLTSTGKLYTMKIASLLEKTQFVHKVKISKNFFYKIVAILLPAKI